jgi:hypothetical protein
LRRGISQTGGSRRPEAGTLYAKSYRKPAKTAMSFASLPGAGAGCFRYWERANSPPINQEEPV